MAHQNHCDLLNRVLVRAYRGLLQYAVECWPWTTATDSPTSKSAEEAAVAEMAARQQRFVARLVELLSQRGAAVDFGSYPDNSELHYVSLDYLLGKLVADEQGLVDELEAAREILREDAEAANLVSQLLSAEKENLGSLREMARAAAAVPA